MKNAVKNVVFPPALSDLEIRGPIARQMDAFLYERIFSDFAKKEIYAETEEKFRLKEDDQHIVGMWRGEFWAKWVISACRVCRHKKDEKRSSLQRQKASRPLHSRPHACAPCPSRLQTPREAPRGAR